MLRAFRYAEPGKLDGLVAQAGATAGSERGLGFQHRGAASHGRTSGPPLRDVGDSPDRVPQLSPGNPPQSEVEVEEAIRRTSLTTG